MTKQNQILNKLPLTIAAVYHRRSKIQSVEEPSSWDRVINLESGRTHLWRYHLIQGWIKSAKDPLVLSVPIVRARIQKVLKSQQRILASHIHEWSDSKRCPECNRRKGHVEGLKWALENLKVNPSNTLNGKQSSMY